MMGAGEKVFPLPVFETIDGQTDYYFLELKGATKLISVIIESNPENVAGDFATCFLTGANNSTIRIPAQPAGLRVFVIFEK